MIDRDHDLSIARRAKALGVARSSVYYKLRPVSSEDLKLMRRLDELHLDHPFAGARMPRDLLRREGVVAGRRHVETLMKCMGIEAIYRRPNQVWATDICYIPMRRGFVYLAAVVDVFTRRVLSHRVSITMEAEFCVEALKEALTKHGKPEISTRIRAVSSPASISPACCSMRRFPSAWTGKTPGATMCSSSGCGAA